MKTKSNHGGRREGAGRKKSGTVEVSWRVHPATKAFIEKQAGLMPVEAHDGTMRHATPGEFLDRHAGRLKV